jgi:hypothetical protein
MTSLINRKLHTIIYHKKSIILSYIIGKGYNQKNGIFSSPCTKTNLLSKVFESKLL